MQEGGLITGWFFPYLQVDGPKNGGSGMIRSLRWTAACLSAPRNIS